LVNVDFNNKKSRKAQEKEEAKTDLTPPELAWIRSGSRWREVDLGVEET
jgi:hypothetical protein